MRDRTLIAMYDLHNRAFPTGHAGSTVMGVDLGLLDETIFGVASHYLNNSRPVTDEHAVALREAIADLEIVLPQIAAPARTFFGEGQQVAEYLLVSRRPIEG